MCYYFTLLNILSWKCHIIEVKIQWKRSVSPVAVIQLFFFRAATLASFMSLSRSIYTHTQFSPTHSSKSYRAFCLLSFFLAVSIPRYAMSAYLDQLPLFLNGCRPPRPPTPHPPVRMHSKLCRQSLGWALRLLLCPLLLCHPGAYLLVLESTYHTGEVPRSGHCGQGTRALVRWTDAILPSSLHRVCCICLHASLPNSVTSNFLVFVI